MNTVIQLNNVTKMFGTLTAVDNVDLTVSKGTIFGFLGPNGAGKSTTINMLIDFIRPTSGKITLLGLDSVNDSEQIHKKIGFLAGDFALDRGLTGWQQLEYFGHLRGSFDKKYINELASRLDCKLDRKFKNLSRGNKQKVGLIAALMHKPELLIFDEPTSGLDPLIQSEFNHIILEQKAKGVTTFISSHMLSEVQEICDNVAFIKSGKVIASKNLSETISKLARQITIIGLKSSDVKSLQKNLKITSSINKNSSFNFAYEGDINSLINTLSKYTFKDITIREHDLESVFMHYYEDENA